MQNNNVIKKRDYERYEILIPFSHFAGKRRKVFLYSELEKMHPCFSDEFTFDSAVKKIEKKGICEDVFVMNKYKLAEYESKRSIAGSGFFLEADKRKYRLFIEKKWKLLLGVIFVFAFSVFIGFVWKFSRSWGSKTEREVQNIVKTSEVVKFETGKSEVAKTEEDLFSTDATSGAIVATAANEVFDLSFEKDFFSLVSSSKGKILHFEWSIEQKNALIYKKVAALVKVLYPENLSTLGLDVTDKVIYEDGIPKMNVSFSGTFSLPELSEVESKSGPNSDFNKSFRNILQQYNADLKEEKAPPYHIEFVINALYEEKNKELIEKLAALIVEDFRHVSAISISQSGNNDLRFGISIEEKASFGFDIELISQYLKIFTPENRIPQSHFKKTETVSKVESNQKNNFQKIGEIKKSGGAVSVFYKNENGKIQNIVMPKEDEK